LLLAALACAPASLSALSDDGSTVVERPEGAASSVRLIFIHYPEDGATAACTGTFISDDVLLTAAHCVQVGAGAPEPVIEDDRTKATDLGFAMACDEPYELCSDIALVVFPKGTYNGPVFKLGLSSVPDGTKLDVYGYGEHGPEPAKGTRDGLMREASLAAYADAGRSAQDIDALGPPVAMPGDSGSPLLLEGDIQGVIRSRRLNPGLTTATRVAKDPEGSGLGFELKLFNGLIAQKADIPSVACQCARAHYKPAGGFPFRRPDERGSAQARMVDLAGDGGSACALLDGDFPDKESGGRTVISGCRAIPEVQMQAKPPELQPKFNLRLPDPAPFDVGL
jgi:hypothetical protein